MRAAIVATLVAAILAPSSASADDKKAKREARAFMREGVRLFSGGEYESALDLFHTAYRRYPSPKILLNIGTTYRELGRLVEAANTYEQYLRSEGKDAARAPELVSILDDIDRNVGKLRFELKERGLVLELDGAEVVELPKKETQPTPIALRKAKPRAEWSAPVLVQVRAQTFVLRVSPGKHVLRAKKKSAPAVERTVTVTAAEEQRVRLFDLPEPRVTSSPPGDKKSGGAPSAGTGESGAKGDESTSAAAKRVAMSESAEGDDDGLAVEASVAPRARGKLGASLNAAVDGKGRGAVFMAAAHLALGKRYELVAAGLFGYSAGAYAGGVAYLGESSLRPFLAAGIPVFFRDGARVGVRGAGGIEWRALERISVSVQLGAEYFPAAEDGFDKFLFVPVLGVTGRL